MLVVVAPATSAQTAITADKNKYTPAQDVQIGREAAQEVRRELPLLKDDGVDQYVDKIGQRLVKAIPSEFHHREFRYSFEVVNQKEINAFALPGGPMFLNRGMIEAAKNEGEVVGVMAHEIAHVALRHGTAQATKAQGFQAGAIAGQIIGAIVGGTAGSVIATGSQLTLGTYFLKYSREYEREADLLGAQIMARAGYDPRRMADMFRTIEKQSRGSGPEWLSSHPNPSNRYEAIQREAAMLTIEGAAPSPAEFQNTKARLASMRPAYTAEQISRAKAQGRRLPGTNTEGASEAPARVSNVRVAPPSGQYREVAVGNVMRIQVPTNWRRVDGNNVVTFAPDGASYRTNSGSTGFTHGVQVGVIASESHNHREATDELIESLAQGNPQIRRQGNGYVQERIGGRTGLSTTLRNISEVTGGAETVAVSTVPLSDGSLLYLIAVAPQEDASDYATAFRRLKQTVTFMD
jgi:hypothetical protein